MVVAHGLAPVSEREVGIECFRLAKRDGSLVELEAVQRFDAFEELRLCRRCARGLERDRAELLRHQWADRGRCGHGEDHDEAAQRSIHGGLPGGRGAAKLARSSAAAYRVS